VRIWFLVLLLGCTELGDYATAPGEVYAGSVVGEAVEDCDPATTACSFIRRGFSPSTRLELTFDPSRADSSPGVVSTVDDTGCAPILDEVPMAAIAPVAHDALGELEFPGADRVRNYLYVVVPESGPLAGRHLTLVLSLIRDGSAEARVLRGSGENVCDPSDCATIELGECDYFGVFHLDRGAR